MGSFRAPHNQQYSEKSIITCYAEPLNPDIGTETELSDDSQIIWACIAARVCGKHEGTLVYETSFFACRSMHYVRCRQGFSFCRPDTRSRCLMENNP